MPHQQRKSSLGLGAADPRKSDPSRQARPTMTRRYTPTNGQRSSKTRYESSSEDESFPQYCMSCEKQFLPAGDNSLYCSESCRRLDQSCKQSTPYCSYNSAGSDYGFSRRPSYYGSDSESHRHSYYATDCEPRDIVPQASPSRPGSMLLPTSPPATPGTYYGSKPESALSALRSLAAIHSPPAPPSPTHYTGGFWPIGKSAATSPSSSYARSSAPYMTTMEPSYTSSHGAADRTLSWTSSRPRSREFVTSIITNRI